MGDKTVWLKEGDSGPLLLLAHGAGAPMDSRFMSALSTALVAAGVRVWRFEFSYMAGRRQGKSRRPPPAAPVLLAEWHTAITSSEAGRLPFIGGKSLGGRMASQLVAQSATPGVQGCLCFGYPFYPPAKPDSWRTGHFPDLSVPTWIAQGERDTFGSRERVLAHLACGLADNPEIEWIPDGNHDFEPRKRSGATWKANLELAATRAAAFMHRHG